ncbi:MAG: hypothetical protein EOM30_00630 [Clostridia bacterium]|nr:hypothetical protein [Clostridia bacterium]
MKAKLNLFSKLALVLTAIFYAACVQLAGGSMAAMTLYFALMALLVFMPGVLICETLLPNAHGAAKLACAFSLGTGIYAVCYMAFGAYPKTVFIIPAILAVIYIVKCAKAKRKFKAESVHTAINLALACGFFVYVFLGVLGFAHASSAGNMTYHQDMMWSVGNGAAASLGAPFADIRAAGGTLHYHWLADALPGLVAYTGNILTYDAAIYYNYPVLLLVFVCAVYAAAKEYSHGSRLAPWLPLLMLVCNGLNSQVTINLLRNNNGVIMAEAVCCTALYIIFSLEKIGFKLNFKAAAAFAVCMGVLLMSKNLYGILLLLALFAAACVHSIVHKKLCGGAFLLCGISAAILAACWVLLYSGAINNLVFQIWQSFLNIPKTLILWLPLGFAAYIASLFLSFKSFGTLSVSRLMVNAAVVGGVCAYFLFNHYSASQTYFLLAAIMFMWFCALDARQLLKNKPVKITACALAALSVCLTAYSLAGDMRTGVQIYLRCGGLRPEYPYTEQTVTTADEAAAMWLRDNMRTDEIFATNRNGKALDAADGTWHYYTAISGRQAFVEGWRYAMDYSVEYSTLRHNLEEVSDKIFTCDTAEEAFAIAKQNGIDYLLISRPKRQEGYKDAAPAFENESCIIYKVA